MVNARRIGRSPNRIAQQTGRGRAVAKLGKLEEAVRLGVLRPAEDAKQSGAQDEQHVDRPQPLNHQLQFEFDDGPAPQSRWVEVNAGGVPVENLRLFGGPWILSHILVCFVACVLWKTLGQICIESGLGNEPRRVLAELAEIRSMDVVLPTRSRQEIRIRCISKPKDHRQIHLEKLGLKLPAKRIQPKM